jgi:membrane-bound lytic murein transglycosylase D
MRLFLAFMTFVVCASPARADIITPRGIESDVQFWEDVFSKYSADTCVFHDRDDLSVIYGVKTLRGNRRAQNKLISRTNAVVRGVLKHLAYGGAPRTEFEQRVVDVTPKHRRYPAYYRYAMDNVRCQRGVDISPSLARGAKYIPSIKRVLRQHDLPEDLAYLPHLESGFRTHIRSHAGARGLWQIMPATGRIHGLKIGSWRDERTDPFKATHAAADILSDLYRKTGSWPLAVTGYNYGVNGIQRAVKAWGPDYVKIRTMHRTRIFGFAARNYYPSFVAVRNIAKERNGNRQASN